MGYMEHHVYLDTEITFSLHQIIEAGLQALEEPYDSDTFEVDCTGNVS